MAEPMGIGAVGIGSGTENGNGIVTAIARGTGTAADVSTRDVEIAAGGVQRSANSDGTETGDAAAPAFHQVSRTLMHSFVFIEAGWSKLRLPFQLALNILHWFVAISYYKAGRVDRV